jgi:hypothetical protein
MYFLHIAFQLLSFLQQLILFGHVRKMLYLSCMGFSGFDAGLLSDKKFVKYINAHQKNKPITLTRTFGEQELVVKGRFKFSIKSDGPYCTFVVEYATWKSVSHNTGRTHVNGLDKHNRNKRRFAGNMDALLSDSISNLVKHFGCHRYMFISRISWSWTEALSQPREQSLTM